MKSQKFVWVAKDDPALSQPSKAVDVPLTHKSKEAVYEVVDSLHRDNCPSVIDSVSAPMLGINLRIVAFHLGLRCSHLRNLNKDTYSVNDKVLLMLNPVIEPEAHTGKSL